MTYTEALRDPRWQRRRLEKMQEASFCCEECGAADKPLNIHHKHYKKHARPWEYDLKDLSCLCDDCHDKTHRPQRNINSFQSLLRAALARHNAGTLGGKKDIIAFVSPYLCSIDSAVERDGYFRVLAWVLGVELGGVETLAEFKKGEIV